MDRWLMIAFPALVIVGACVPFLALNAQRRARRLTESASAHEVISVANHAVSAPRGAPVLITFAIIVLVYGALVGWQYWESVKALKAEIILAVGLFLMMVGGMLVRVCSQNYQKGRPLFDVSKSELIYPMLFSPIVFFSIWAIEKSPKPSVFWFYSAFLNGYFWESIVSAAKPIQSEHA